MAIHTFAKCVTDCVARPCTVHQSHLTIKLSNMYISKIWRYIYTLASTDYVHGSVSDLHSFRLGFKQNKLMVYVIAGFTVVVYACTIRI